jgi:mannose/fructose/N-acetylgalactosamine-specific phosphotransferase system component IIC
VTWAETAPARTAVPAFGATRFDISYIVPVGYAIFAMALGICAGTLLRRALPALAVTLAGFAALRVLTTWLRPHYMTPVTAYYKLTAAAFSPAGPYLGISHGGPNELVAVGWRRLGAALAPAVFDLPQIRGIPAAARSPSYRSPGS